MKTVKNILLAASLILAAVNISSGGTIAPQERTKTFSVNKGGRLYVDVNPGQITIVPWDKNEVVVKIKEMEEDELDNVKMESDKNEVRVGYDSKWGGSDAEFYINVPSQFNLELASTAGDVEVRGNISGDVHLKTNGGDISLKNVNGNLTASTDGGDIRIGDVEGELKINTDGGDIAIGAARGKTVRAVTSGGDIHITKSIAGTYLRTSGGDIYAGDLGSGSELLTSGGSLSAGIVSGGIRMETSGGDIELKGAKGKVIAKTSAGNITLKNVSGEVTAKTSAGDVDVMLDPSAGSESVMSTSSGEVVLRLPSSAKTEVEAEVSLRGSRGKWGDDKRIHSDFQVKESPGSGDSKNLSKAKYVINGGGSKISLSSADSGIKILKSDK